MTEIYLAENHLLLKTGYGNLEMHGLLCLACPDGATRGYACRYREGNSNVPRRHHVFHSCFKILNVLP